APKGLVSQWVAEMRTHFNEHFQLVLPDDIKTLSRISVVQSSKFEVQSFQLLGFKGTWLWFSQ
ncbi:MAG: hypothetical protein Q7V36_08565, partial [Deltaproteobacteria bacterium]|nr:hypothetical protein [Deltaproteobacteria bacterium]